MSAHCHHCGFDLPYEGDCLYCTAKARVADLEAALRKIASEGNTTGAVAAWMQGVARDALREKEAGG